MEFTSYIIYIKISLFCFVITSILKSIIKYYFISIHNVIKPLYLFFSIIIGSAISYFLINDTFLGKIIIGCLCGYFAPIIYSILIKSVYKKFDILTEKTDKTNKTNSNNNNNNSEYPDIKDLYDSNPK